MLLRYTLLNYSTTVPHCLLILTQGSSLRQLYWNTHLSIFCTFLCLIAYWEIANLLCLAETEIQWRKENIKINFIIQHPSPRSETNTWYLYYGTNYCLSSFFHIFNSSFSPENIFRRLKLVFCYWQFPRSPMSCLPN